jgi:spore coat assembly protein
MSNEVVIMYSFKVGEIVSRKSYGKDINFEIVEILESNNKPIYILRGLFYRIMADSNKEDLVKLDLSSVQEKQRKDIYSAKRNMNRNMPLMDRVQAVPFFRISTSPGKILHIDSDEKFLNICVDHYRGYGISVVGKVAKESDQPKVVRTYLEMYRPNVLILTGHDSFKKNSNLNNLDSYRNSKYFGESVRAARKFEPNPNKLCVFSGACQSYYELIMDEGANFASSPGRILINAIDPAFVAQKISLTSPRTTVTPREIASLLISGSKGIWGKNSRGQLGTRSLLRRL